MEVKQKLDRGDKFTLIDVREPFEAKIASISGARLIPLGEFPKHIGEFEPESEIVVHCKAGGRSARACGILRNAGFKNVRNMRGGILAWSARVPKY
jgi:adenylyltransferase/sulfurtransferase